MHRAQPPDRDFFIRKAIGWALRAYAWHEPEWVRTSEPERVSRDSAQKEDGVRPSRRGRGRRRRCR
ncbi:MAG: DNA alkylation repair protein [Candidatus Dormibacteria bacterium]